MNQVIGSKNKGFTLMELMVAIAIMGITTAIGLPSLQTTIASNRLTTSANDMLAALQSARSEAIKRIQVCGVSITGNSWVVYVSTGANVIQQYATATGVSMTVTSSLAGDTSLDTLSYRPDGRLNSSNTYTATFTATGTTEKRILTLAPSGKVTITKS